MDVIPFVAFFAGLALGLAILVLFLITRPTERLDTARINWLQSHEATITTNEGRFGVLNANNEVLGASEDLRKAIDRASDREPSRIMSVRDDLGRRVPQ